MGYVFSRDNIQPAQTPVIVERISVYEKQNEKGEWLPSGMGIIRNPPYYTVGELRAMRPMPKPKLARALEQMERAVFHRPKPRERDRPKRSRPVVSLGDLKWEGYAPR